MNQNGFDCGTHAVAAVYQARAGAEIIAEIGVDRIREKSLRLTGKILARCEASGYSINSPRESAPSAR